MMSESPEPRPLAPHYHPVPPSPPFSPSPGVACQLDCIVNQLNALCSNSNMTPSGQAGQEGSSRFQKDGVDSSDRTAAEAEGRQPLPLWTQPEQQHHLSVSPFSSPDPQRAVQQQQVQEQQQQQQQQQMKYWQPQLHVSIPQATPEVLPPSGSAPASVPSLASIASSQTGHLPPGRIGSPGVGGGPPFNRSMSALDLEPRASVGERVRAGRGKAVTSYDYEGKVHGGMSRSASRKSSSLMEDSVSFDGASPCACGGSFPLSNTRSVDNIFSSARMHRSSQSQPHFAVGLQLGLSSPTLSPAPSAYKRQDFRNASTGRLSGDSLSRQPSIPSSSFMVRGGAPSFPSLIGPDQGGGPPPFLLASPNSKACSSGGNSNSEVGSGSLAGIGGVAAADAVRSAGCTPIDEQEGQHRGGRSRSCSNSGVGDVEMRRSCSNSGVGDVMWSGVAQEGREGAVQEVQGVTEADEEEQRVQGLLLGAGAGASSCCSSSSSRAQSHDAHYSGGSLLMAVAEEECECFSAGSRPVQTLPSGSSQDSQHQQEQQQQQPDSQQQVSQQQRVPSASHLLNPSGLTSPSAAQKVIRSSSSGRSRESMGRLGEALSGGLGFPGGAVNSYGSCGSSLSLLEFADESSCRSLGSMNISAPQSPCNMLFKVRPSGGGEAGTHSGTMKNSSKSMQAGLCSLAPAASLEGSLSVPCVRQGEMVGRDGLSRPRKVSLPHTMYGSATSPHSPCFHPSNSISTSYSSLLEYAEASASCSQSRKLSSTGDCFGGGHRNSCDEQQL